MKKAVGLLVLLLLGTFPAWGQSTKRLNLGELARKVRAERAGKDLSDVPYFTNDNLPKRGEISIVGGRARAAAPGAEGEAAESQAQPQAAGEECGEDCWRQKFREQREKIQRAKHELDVLQREYQLNRTQYYQDPNRAVREQYSNTVAGGRELQDLLERIRDKQQQIGRLEQELRELENELRRTGGKPGWARPE